MRIETLGTGSPEVAVLAGVHGDEPCGVSAVESFVEADPDVERPVALVVANERALDAGTRYVDEDLNRAFPGDADGETHESRLAARIADRFGDVRTLSLHSTQSYERPFAIVPDRDPRRLRRCAHLSVDVVVDAGAFDQGRLFTRVPDTIEIECGRQGSEAAAENARRILREFLGATGVLPDAARQPQVDLPVYELERQIAKPDATEYDVFVDNFEPVAPGTPFAAADGEEFEANEPFYPVLMSARGYERVFGYAASLVETV